MLSLQQAVPSKRRQLTSRAAEADGKRLFSGARSDAALSAASASKLLWRDTVGVERPSSRYCGPIYSSTLARLDRWN